MLAHHHNNKQQQCAIRSQSGAPKSPGSSFPGLLERLEKHVDIDNVSGKAHLAQVRPASAAENSR